MNEQISDISSGAQDLTSMVMVQPGAVVSRTLVNKPAGTITLFAFDAGEGLSEHTAPYDALVHVIEGEASVRIAGTEHTVRGGQVILLPANQPHALKAIEPFKMLLTMIRQ
jgi:quercetin dioxygenase-like cupin family protein